MNTQLTINLQAIIERFEEHICGLRNSDKVFTAQEVMQILRRDQAVLKTLQMQTA